MIDTYYYIFGIQQQTVCRFSKHFHKNAENKCMITLPHKILFKEIPKCMLCSHFCFSCNPNDYERLKSTKKMQQRCWAL